MHRIMFGVIGLAGLLSGAASGAESTSNASPTPDPNEVVCKDAAAETGSMLGHRRICMTRMQWQQQHQDDRDEVNRAQMHSLDARPAGG